MIYRPCKSSPSVQPGYGFQRDFGPLTLLTEDKSGGT